MHRNKNNITKINIFKNNENKRDKDKDEEEVKDKEKIKNTNKDINKKKNKKTSKSKNETRESNIKNKQIDNKQINKKRIVESIIIILIVILLLSIVLYKLITFIKNPTDTFSIEQGRIYQEESATGYIIRDEVVIKGNNYKNGIDKIKGEGERVAKGEHIFRYYSNSEDNLVKKIKELDIKIDEAMANQKNYVLSDIKSIDRKIEEDIDSIYNLNNLQEINEKTKTITKNINKKSRIAGEKSPAGSYLKKLVDERKKYENQLNEGAEYVDATRSGVVSYKVDGLEEILKPGSFENLSKDYLEKLKIKVGQQIADSEEGGKIINNFICYIACILDSKEAQNAKIGDEVTIRLSNNLEIKAEVSYIAKEDKENLIIFEISEQVQELITYRKISLDIVWWSYKGKKVPNIAIREEEKGENKVNYIIRNKNENQDKILVKVLKSNDKYSIVDNYTSEELKKIGYSEEEIRKRKTMTLYDEIITEPM